MDAIERLEMLYKELQKVEYKHHSAFRCYLTGALAVEVNDEGWERAVRVAAGLVKDLEVKK